MRLNVMMVVSVFAAACGADVEEGGDVTGSWRVTWACDEGCAGSPVRPALTYSGLVDVDLGAGELRWSDDDCVECNAVHLIDVADDACAGVAALMESVLDRSPYMLCATASEKLGGEVAWVSAFSGEATRWTASGIR